MKPAGQVLIHANALIVANDWSEKEVWDLFHNGDF
jgi:hypothetical protein